MKHHQTDVFEISSALYIVNVLAKRQSDKAYSQKLYSLKMKTIDKLISIELAEKIGLHYVLLDKSLDSTKIYRVLIRINSLRQSSTILLSSNCY